MSKKLLHESITTPLKREGSRWRAVLITPGQGSSANYSESALQASVSALGNGTKNWFKHPEKASDQRDPRDQWGVIPESVSYEPGVGLVAEIQVLPHWKELVDSLAEAGQAELSIWAMGDTDEQGNLISLTEDVQNSVDLVGYPGRPGSGLTEKMYESARAGSAQVPDVTSAQVKKEGTMDKEILDALTALKTSFDTFATDSKETVKAVAQAEADAGAIDTAVETAIESYDAKIAAITAADLLPSQVESLRAEAKLGHDVTPLIESAKKIVAEAKTLVEAADAVVTGRVVEGAADADYTVARWKVAS
jgi:hypothetical protein